jgi:hypothetical protein
MIHALLIGLAIYLGGLLATALVLAIGSFRSGERLSSYSDYDRKFIGCGLLLWFITLPVVLSLLVGMRGPREDGDGEGADV